MKKIILAVLTLILLTVGLVAASLFINAPELLTNIFSAEEINKDTFKIKTDSSYEERIEKGQLLIENGYYSLSITEFNLASQEKPYSPEPYLLIGSVYENLKDYEKAISNYEKALERSPDNSEAIIGIAQNYIHLEKFEEARATIDGSSKESSDLNYYKALLYAYDSEYDRSQQLFEEIEDEKAEPFLSAFEEYDLEEGGQETHLKTLLAQAYTEVKQWQLAKATLYEVLGENSSYRDAWTLLGYTYLSLGQYEDSASAFEQAIELDVTKPETNYFLALAYFGQDRHEDAITYLELSLLYGFEPQVQVYQKLAEIYFLLEDYESASRNYEQILKLNDEDANNFIRPIWLNLDFLGNHEHALELAEWALDSHPETAMSYNLKGWVLTAMEDYEEAETYLKGALELDPNLAAAYLNLGTMYEKQDNLEEAKQNYKIAYTLDQNSAIGSLAAEKYNALL
ncbi:MAG: tetratricopeptide repeat protein [Patescibacteria group bacterium]|nr:tetratricopeptide repeat protein [Patescibacteria group bacterium]